SHLFPYTTLFRSSATNTTLYATVQLYTTFPKTVLKPKMAIEGHTSEFGDMTYTLTITNFQIGRDVEMQYTDGLQKPWQHSITINLPATNTIQVSDFIYLIFGPNRFFRARPDYSTVFLPWETYW